MTRLFTLIIFQALVRFSFGSVPHDKCEEARILTNLDNWCSDSAAFTTVGAVDEGVAPATLEQLDGRGGCRLRRRRLIDDRDRGLVEFVRMNHGVGNLANHHREEGRGQNAARNRVEIGHSRIPKRQ